ncbi:MAG: hypothetical protein WC091_06450 [Sulfuricellaceae bacterium]
METSGGKAKNDSIACAAPEKYGTIKLKNTLPGRQLPIRNKPHTPIEVMDDQSEQRVFPKNEPTRRRLVDTTENLASPRVNLFSEIHDENQ